ncbi:MAG: GNAT family N-acetyltransferase [Minwuia sp.]|nr:GNAT family N-acetyltransferase [Minwuia sp.]
MTEIRPATLDDVPAITAIYAHWVETGTSSFELTAPDTCEMRARFTALLDKDLPWLAATRGGAVVGYAYAGLYRPRPAYRFTLEDSIYLAPDAVGTGIGRPLLSALIDACRVAGCRNLMAIVGDNATNTGSVRLHIALGFEPVGTARNIGFKFDRWLDVMTLQKVL